MNNGKRSIFKYIYNYLKGLLPIALQVICAYVIIGFTAYAFYLFVDDWIIIRYPAINEIFYVFCVILCAVYICAACYKAALKQSLNPAGEANSFKYFNGFIIGALAVLPIAALCIAGTASGYTYYHIDYGMTLAKMFFYLFAYPFDSHRFLDFSFMQFFLVALIPFFLCAASYAARGMAGAVKKNKEVRQ